MFFDALLHSPLLVIYQGVEHRALSVFAWKSRCDPFIDDGKFLGMVMELVSKSNS